jgi:hypothetical protein
VQGWALGNRNYWKPEWQLALKEQGLDLLAPYKSAKCQTFRYPHWLVEKRYRIETVFGQMVERFHAKKVRARDAWHLTSRWLRKLGSHLIAVLFCQRLGLSSLRFSELLSDKLAHRVNLVDLQSGKRGEGDRVWLEASNRG